MRSSMTLADTKKEKRTTMSFRLTDAFNKKPQPLKHSETMIKNQTPQKHERRGVFFEVEKTVVFGTPLEKLKESQCGFKGVPLVIEDCCHHIRDCVISNRKFINKWDNKQLNKFLVQHGGKEIKNLTGKEIMTVNYEDLKKMGFSEEEIKKTLNIIQEEKKNVISFDDILNNKFSCCEIKQMYELIKKYDEGKHVNLYECSTVKISMLLLRTYFIMLEPSLFNEDLCKKIDSIFTQSNNSDGKKHIYELQQQLIDYIKESISPTAFNVFNLMNNFFLTIGNHPKSLVLNEFNEIVIYFFESFNPRHEFDQGYLELIPILLGLSNDDQINLLPPYRIETLDRYDGEFVQFTVNNVICPYFFFPLTTFNEYNTAGWFKGILYITNYRMLLDCDDTSMLYDVCFTQVPLNNIGFYKITKEYIEGKVYSALRIIATDFGHLTFFCENRYSEELLHCLEEHIMFFNFSYEQSKFNTLGIKGKTTKQLITEENKRQNCGIIPKEYIHIWKNPNSKVELNICQTGMTTNNNYIQVNGPDIPFASLIELINNNIGTPISDDIFNKMTQFAYQTLEPAKEIAKKLLTQSVLVSSNGIGEIKALLAISIISLDSYYLSLDGFMVMYRTFFKFTDTYQRMVFLWMIWLIMNQHPQVFGFNYNLVKTLFYHITALRFNDDLLHQFVLNNRQYFATIGKVKFAILNDIIPRPSELFFQHPSIQQLPKMNQQIVIMKNTSASTLLPFTPTTIQTLEVENNKFFDIPMKVLSFSKLNTLKMANNKIYVLSDGISSFHNLTYLDVSNNNIKWFPLLGVIKLKYLDISNNPITTISFLPTTLTTLNMRGLCRMPDLTQHSLITLDCSGTSSISSKTLFHNLPKTLKELDISSRGMLSLPIKISKLTSLTKLNLSNNYLTVFHPSFFELGIKELNIEHNHIKMLPPTFKKMPIEKIIKDDFSYEKKVIEKRVVLIDNSTEIFNSLIRQSKHINWNIKEEPRSAKLIIKNNIVIDLKVLDLESIESQPYFGIDALYIIHIRESIPFRIIDLCQVTSSRNYIVISDKIIEDMTTIVYDGTPQTLKSICRTLRKFIEDFGKDEISSNCYEILKTLQCYDLSPAVMTTALYQEIISSLEMKENDINKAVHQLVERRLLHRSCLPSTTPRNKRGLRPSVIEVRTNYSTYYSEDFGYILVDTLNISHIAASLLIQTKGIFTARALQSCKMNGMKNNMQLNYIISVLEEYSIVLKVRLDLAKNIGCENEYPLLLEQAKQATLVSQDVCSIGNDIILLSLVGVPYIGNWEEQNDTIISSRQYTFNKFPLQLQQCFIASCALYFGMPYSLWRSGVIFKKEIRNEVIDVLIKFSTSSFEVHTRYHLSSLQMAVDNGNIHHSLEKFLDQLISIYFLNVKFSVSLLCPHCLNHSIKKEDITNSFLIHEEDHSYNIPLIAMDYFFSILPPSLSSPTLIKEITRGSSSIIYLCVGGIVLKQINSDFKSLKRNDAIHDFNCRIHEFYNEVIFSQYCFDNVGRILGYVTEPFGIEMEYYDGGSLFDLIGDFTQPIPVHSILVDIANGMKNIHQINKLHRDLKSLNILLKKQAPNMFQAFVCDFGESTIEGEQQSQIECPFWLAPEIFKGEQWTKASDVYSYGVIIWEVITRQRPYEGKFYNEVKESIIEGERLEIPKNCRYEDLMKKCWLENTEQRPSFEDILNILKQL
ncbi:hypothetical protein CL6EHI_197200 [Entamoeba histolytica]|nr:hypothetical protein CL6EHI_197200 [Entamoeba histolytica]